MARLLVRLCSQSNKTTDSAAATICDGSLKNARWSVHQGKPVSVFLPPFLLLLLCYLMLLFSSKPRTFLFGRYFILRRPARCLKYVICLEFDLTLGQNKPI